LKDFATVDGPDNNASISWKQTTLSNIWSLQVNDDQEHIDAISTNPSASSSVPNVRYVEPRRRHLAWLWWTLAVLLLVVIGIGVAHRAKTRQDTSAVDQTVAPNVNVATSFRGNIGLYVEALGTVTPVATVNVYTQITGKVVGVHYSEGQMVRRGDPLIDIDPQPYEAQLLEAQGTLDHDRGLLAQAEIDLARYKDASANNAIARQTYEDQEQAVVQYKGTVKNDLGQVQYAQVQLSYCHIVSPITGRVGLRLVDAGNTVFSGSSNALVVITQLQPITVVFNVAEDNLVKLHDQIKHRGALLVDAYDRAQLKKIGTGKLLTLDNQIDSTTGTVRFRGQFDNADLNLYPNQFVNARLLTSTLQDATLVPSSAIQHNGVDAFVYRVVGQIAKIQPVREVTSEGEMTAVEGIQPGDVVAISGFDKLQDGTKINILSGATPTDAINQKGGGSR
jgi:multidrug efflux system membrane fusion protein